jgi:hypothetical protein
MIHSSINHGCWRVFHWLFDHNYHAKITPMFHCPAWVEGVWNLEATERWYKQVRGFIINSIGGAISSGNIDYVSVLLDRGQPISYLDCITAFDSGNLELFDLVFSRLLPNIRVGYINTAIVYGRADIIAHLSTNKN